MDEREACRPSVSVIVPGYGVAHLLGETLASLQAQVRCDWEAIVVDDGDPDDVARAFAPFSHDPRFRLLNTDNGGLAAARNRAIAVSRAPFVALLDGDDLYEPEYVGRMLKAIEADPGLGFVSCDATMFGARRYAGRLYSDDHPMAGPVTLERVLSREVAIVVAAIIRRSAFESVGGFDSRLRSVEDLDLWIRLLAAGWRGEVVRQPLVRYRRRRGSLSDQPLGMLASSCDVYRKAGAALRTRSEGCTAERMLAICSNELEWLKGQEAILRGDYKSGLALLRGAEQRSWRWRFALAIFRRAAWAAPLLLRLRAALPRPLDLLSARRRSAGASWK